MLLKKVLQSKESPQPDEKLNQIGSLVREDKNWIPAFAGMTRPEKLIENRMDLK